MSTLARRIRRFLTWPIQLFSSLSRPLRHLLVLGLSYNTSSIASRQVDSNTECNPTPLTAQRPRRLTLPDSTGRTDVGTVQELQKTHDQLQSRLFARLPLELRQVIYGYVLGGKVIHITRLPTRLGHVTCFHESRHEGGTPYSPSSHQCWGIRFPRTTLYNGLWDESRIEDQDALNALLKTCRRVYSESIGYLYKDNIFDVNAPETILLLKQTVLLSRLQLISAVQMTWGFVSERDVDTSERLRMRQGAWEQVWKVLGDMKGLQSLRVELQHDPAMGVSAEYEESVVFQRAKNVRLFGGKKWMLVLCWDPKEDSSETEQLPFRVEYRPFG